MVISAIGRESSGNQIVTASGSLSENLFVVKFCVDDNNIYYYIEYTGINAFDMYLNTDGNTSTGYIPGVGSEYMVEGWFEDGMAYPGLYQHNTADQEAWSFDEVSAAVMSNSASAVLGNGHSAFEGSIALTSFTTGVTSLQVMVSAVDEGWNDVGSLPEDGSLLTVPMPEIDIPTSGSCGENLTWSFAEGVLTITGTGAMTSSPWNPLKSDIQSVGIRALTTSSLL